MTADRATITNEGGLFPNGFGGSGRTEFQGSATAGFAVILNAPSVGEAVFGGITLFNTGSTAGAASITNAGGRGSLAQGGLTEVRGTSAAGTATIINRGGEAPNAEGGRAVFSGTTTAAGSSIRSEGGTVGGAGSGSVRFFGSATAGQATLTGTGGVPAAAGGSFIFAQTSDGGTARVILEGSGDQSASLDISQLTGVGIGLGSIEGSGIVSLGSKNLTLGRNTLSTEFSGLIRDGGIINANGGSLTKIGTGPLTLSGANTYTGGTLIGNGFSANSGKIIAANISGSATGSGPVTIRRGGTLSGSGFIGGLV